MRHYRLYFLGVHGRFIRAEDINVADDVAAIQTARDLDHANCIEVWERTRQVAIVRPEAEGEAAAVKAS
jgi:hypothetical protein